ncbi:MAG: EF-hand domain-containing protein [Pararhodobacter sp.]
MKTGTLTAIALIFAAIPVAGFAQSAPVRPAPPTLDFAAADADGSGAISPEEWTAYVATLRDGMREQMIGARVDALIAAADTDGDGALTRDELIAGMTAMAAERGERGEGRSFGRPGHRGPMMGHHQRGEGTERGDRAELGEGRRGDRSEMRAQMRGERGDRAERGEGPRRDRSEMRAQMRGGERGGLSFARIDTNGDGQIDAEELAHAQDVLNWMAQRPRRN